MSPLASQLLLWIGLPLAAVGLASVLGIFHGWLSGLEWVQRINARVAGEFRANPLGAAKVWNGGRR